MTVSRRKNCPTDFCILFQHRISQFSSLHSLGSHCTGSLWVYLPDQTPFYSMSLHIFLLLTPYLPYSFWIFNLEVTFSESCLISVLPITLSILFTTLHSELSTMPEIKLELNKYIILKKHGEISVEHFFRYEELLYIIIMYLNIFSTLITDIQSHNKTVNQYFERESLSQRFI